MHDEYGRVDPAKAAEPSKPRGSSSSKRPSRPSDENGPNKRAKTSDDALDDLIDPALTNGDTAVFGAEAVEESFHTPGPFMDNDHDDSEDAIPMLNGRTDPQLTDDDGPDTPPVDPAFTAIAVETAETVDIKMEHDQADTIVVGGDVTESVASRHDSAFATPVPIKNGSSVNGDHSAIATSTPGSRQSSRQHKQVERYTPEDKRSPSKTYPKPPRSDRRGSSAASAQTAMMSEKSRRSSSHTSSTLHQMARVGMLAGHSASIEASARPNSSGSTAESDVDADERFARDLQAAENGLRRRTSMRA